MPDEPTPWLDWLMALGGVAAAAGAGLVAHAVGFSVLRRLAARTPTHLDDRLVQYARRPGRVIVPLLAVMLIMPSLPLPGAAVVPLWHALSLALIAAGAWLLIALAALVEDAASGRYNLAASDNLQARRVFTQLRVLRRTASVVVVIIAAAAMLMTFPRARELGGSLLASAGLAGIAVGFAARPVLQNLIAGVQIALTQPIRIDDVVLIEGEFGWIEEIGTTYVVVRVWDRRRLVVPLNYFIENIFQNWTRTTADLLGAVFIYVDYTAPIEPLRAELGRVLEGNPLWDGKVAGVQVVDATEQTLKVRVLVGARDAPSAWDLRCTVRERLVTFLQENYPAALPRVRAVVERSREDGAPGGATASA
jgi:small-conductance mechanosensitive channel